MHTRISRSRRLLSFAPLAAVALAACTNGGGSSRRAPTSLAYSDPTAAYELCGAISENLPTVGGGSASSFAVTPALPAGLSLDSATGVISGTPSATSAAATYTITAANAVGETSVDITISVAHVPPSGVDYPDLGDELGRGVYFYAEPLLSAGHGSTWSISSGSLPTGLALDSSTGVISGVPTAFGAAAFDITVEDCASATTFSAFATVVVVPYVRGFCAVDEVQGTLASLRRTHTSGALTHGGQVFDADSTAQLAVHPWSRIAFTAAGGDIAVHSIDSRSLELLPTAFSASIGAATIADLAVTPDGEWLYASASTGEIYSFDVEPLTGELSATSPASVLAGGDPQQIVIDPTSSFLFVACSAVDAVEAYAIDGGTGLLTSIGSSASGNGVNVLALTSDGARLYAGSSADSSVFGYDVDGLTGALSDAAWSPLDIGAAAHSALAVSADDATLYLGHSNDTLVRQFALDALTGEPSAIAGAPDALDVTRQIMIESRGNHVYTVQAGGLVQCWDADPIDGALTAAPNGALLASESVTELAPVLGHARFRPQTQHVYATSLAADGVYEYAFDSTGGTLTTQTGSPFATGQDPQTVSVHPFDDYALVAHQLATGSGAVTVHAIDSEGLLAIGTRVGTTNSNVGLEIDRSGRFAYLVRSSAGSSQLVRYAFDATNGTVDPLSSSTFPGTAWPPAIHGSGRLLVVPDSAGDELEVFALDAQTGAATRLTPVSTGGVDPFRAVFDGSGRFVITAHLGSDAIAVHAVDLASGALTPIAGSPFATGITPLVMAGSRDGSALMIADTLDGAWEYYTLELDPTSATANGTPSLVGSASQPGISIVRFDATGTKLFWVDSTSNELNCSTITAPGTLAAPSSSVPIGTQITAMDMRDR